MVDKEKKAMDLKNLETRLFTENHTKDILFDERSVLNKKVGDLK